MLRRGSSLARRAVPAADRISAGHVKLRLEGGWKVLALGGWLQGTTLARNDLIPSHFFLEQALGVLGKVIHDPGIERSDRFLEFGVALQRQSQAIR